MQPKSFEPCTNVYLMYICEQMQEKQIFVQKSFSVLLEKECYIIQCVAISVSLYTMWWCLSWVALNLADDSRENKRQLTCLNWLNIRNEIQRRSLTNSFNKFHYGKQLNKLVRSIFRDGKLFYFDLMSPLNHILY